jgi:Flp pilus assembly pilin Flp
LLYTRDASRSDDADARTLNLENPMSNLLKRLRHEEDAATAVEYAIIAAIVGVALIGTLIAFRDSISQMLRRAAGVIANQ